MLFNSYLFIFLFLPVCLAGWYGLHRWEKHKLALAFLVGMSLWFYGYFNPIYLWIILGSLAGNYGLSAILDRYENKAVVEKWIRAVGILGNLGLLGVFKYYDFFIENINGIFQTGFLCKHIMLPLGISFFTFQQLSFVLDRCKGTAPHYDILDYLAFVTFFPQLIAGPIVLHSELIPQFRDKSRWHFDRESFARGMVCFAIGLCKKVVLADSLSGPVDYGFTHITGLDSLSAVLVALSFTLQLYFDFSGYCDMAVGIGKMFHLELPQNFNSPYQSASVKEFWRRWHMTLGRFFTTYVYIPLGGNRRGKARTILNTMVVFLASGLWHGANWTFVFWGFLHGLGVSFSNLLGTGRTNTDQKKPFWKKGITFCYVMLAFVFFRADSLRDGFIFMKQLFTPCYSGRMLIVADHFEIAESYLFTKMVSLKAPLYLEWAQFAVYVVFLLICLVILGRKNTKQIMTDCQWSTKMAAAVAVLLVWSVISLTGVSTFLYFNF